MSGLVGFYCEWGEKAHTEEDPGPCGQRAVGVVAVKDGSKTMSIKVCMSHRMLLIEETNPL